jgi:spoIIIJ-associated protein
MGVMEFDGKDLDDALATAARVLGRPPAELDYQLVEGGRKGVFGLGARPVRIRVEGAPPIVEENPSPSTEDSPAAGTLRRIIAGIGFDLSVEEIRTERTIELALDGPDRQHLVADGGQLLGALEFVLGRMGRRLWPGRGDVRVTCRGFRSERDVELVAMAREAATQVARSGRPQRFHAMNPYERRVVHVTVREFDGLTTISEGEGFLKRIRVEKIGR